MHLQETEIIWDLDVGVMGRVTDKPLLYPSYSDLKLSEYS